MRGRHDDENDVHIAIRVMPLKLSLLMHQHDSSPRVEVARDYQVCTPSCVYFVTKMSEICTIGDIVTLRGESLPAPESMAIFQIHADWMNKIMRGEPLPHPTSALEIKAKEGFELGLAALKESDVRI